LIGIKLLKIPKKSHIFLSAKMKIPEEYNHKAVLLDTSVLIEISKGRDKMRPFSSVLQEANLAPYIIDAIYFEFVGHACSLRERTDLESLVSAEYPVVPSRSDDVANAVKLSQLYSIADRGRYKNIGYVDCLIAAQLLRYKNHVLLATLNIDDFPVFIFDRVVVSAYDVGEKVVTIALIGYNDEKMNIALERYNRAVEVEKRKTI